MRELRGRQSLCVDWTLCCNGLPCGKLLRNYRIVDRNWHVLGGKLFGSIGDGLLQLWRRNLSSQFEPELLCELRGGKFLRDNWNVGCVGLSLGQLLRFFGTCGRHGGTADCCPLCTADRGTLQRSA